MSNKNNLYSFIFTGTLLLLVFLFKTDSDAKNNSSYQESIKDTSLMASTQMIYLSPIPQVFIPKKETNNNFALETKSEESKPSKKQSVSEPTLSSKIVFVKDLENGKELFSFGTEKYWPIASITKLLTAIVALEKIGPDKTISISQTSIDTEGVAGNFLVNEKYLLRDLVKIMLTVSSNDAASAISEFYGQENFIKEMNLKAEKIGMSQTKFYDCTGLSIQNKSTTSDLTKLTEYIIREKGELLEYTRTKDLSVIELGSNSNKVFTNINYFSGREDFVGGKTGFIESSEQNLLSVFNYKNHKILIIILGSGDRYLDTQQILDWIKISYNF